jgi:hypothetical protein
MQSSSFSFLVVTLSFVALVSCNSRPSEPIKPTDLSGLTKPKSTVIERSDDGQFRPADPATWIATSSRDDFMIWDINWWKNTHPSPAMIQAVKVALVEKITKDKNPDLLRPFLIYANGVGMPKDRSTHEFIREVINRFNATSENEKWMLLDDLGRPDGPWIANSITRH